MAECGGAVSAPAILIIEFPKLATMRSVAIYNMFSYETSGVSLWRGRETLRHPPRVAAEP